MNNMEKCFCTLWDSYIKQNISYYGIDINSEKLFGKYAESECCDLIKKHFEKGGKSSVLDEPREWGFLNSDRCIHTTSLYLLGLALGDLFRTGIYNELHFIKDLNVWYGDDDFMYTWFMTCLFHDAASCIEKNARTNSHKQLLHTLDKKYLNNKFFAKNIIPKRYDAQTIRNYFKFQKRFANEQDHGIIGGTYLFDALLKNYAEHEKRCTRGEAQEIDNELNWCESQKMHYAYVANAIICHNVWTVNSTDLSKMQKYMDNGLEALVIGTNHDKLSITQYSLQFMLCILDTIEPVKKFDKLTVREVLENISIEQNTIADEEKQIRVAWTNKIKRQSEFWLWMKNISNMAEWMRLEISPCNKEGEWCYVTIDF